MIDHKSGVQILSKQKRNTASQESDCHFSDSISDFFKSDKLDSDNKLECQLCGHLNKSEIRFRLKTCKFYSSLIL